MRNDLPVLAAGTALHEIYLVYARLRNALRIVGANSAIRCHLCYGCLMGIEPFPIIRDGTLVERLVMKYLRVSHPAPHWAKGGIGYSILTPCAEPSSF
jgi:hypothetical protein